MQGGKQYNKCSRTTANITQTLASPAAISFGENVRWVFIVCHLATRTLHCNGSPLGRGTVALH